MIAGLILVPKVKRFERQITYKVVGSKKTKGHKKDAKIVYGHQCMKEENGSFI